MIVYLNTINEYEQCLKSGINALFWHRQIKLVPSLRRSIQNKLFGKSELGKGNIVRANDKFYHYCFENSLKICEECGIPIYSNRNYDCYSATYVSHILSRSKDPGIAHDPRNHNILCPECHKIWESLKNKQMLIYNDNQIVIREIILDYRMI